VPRLASYNLTFALQLRKSTEKTSVRVAEKVPVGTRRGVRGHFMGNHEVTISLRGTQVDVWAVQVSATVWSGLYTNL
jgi:hypothetical protein